MTNRKWLLHVRPQAVEDVNELPRKDASAVLDSIENLLIADNPFAVHGVKKVKGRDGVWRQRRGNYRIFFGIDSTPVAEGENTYKGTLIVIAVSKRDESTYR